jgi:hypothetical protein
VIWIVWVLAGLAGTSLLGPPAIWSGTDPGVNKSHYKAAPIEYRSWTSSPRFDKPGFCTYMVFALVTRERLMRLRVDGREQLVDWSWSWEVEVPVGITRDLATVEYIDPVTHEVVATHTVSETCWART